VKSLVLTSQRLNNRSEILRVRKEFQFHRRVQRQIAKYQQAKQLNVQGLILNLKALSEIAEQNGQETVDFQEELLTILGERESHEKREPKSNAFEVDFQNVRFGVVQFGGEKLL
jgi:hypothetical protein